MESLGFEINEDGQIEWRNNGGVIERRFIYGANPDKWEAVMDTPDTPRTPAELESFCEAGNFGYKPPKKKSRK